MTVTSDVSEDRHSHIHFLRLRLDPHRLIYATIIMLVALALFDESVDPFTGSTIVDIFVVVLLPLFALSLAHGFSDALDIQILSRRRLTATDRRHLVTSSIQYLLVGIPVLVMAVVFGALSMNVQLASDIGQLLGVVSLLLWGGYAARRAGLGTWVQVRYGLIYGFIGAMIVVVELLFAH